MPATVGSGVASVLGVALLALALSAPVTAAAYKPAVAPLLQEFAKLRSYALNRAAGLREEGRVGEAQAIEAAVQEADSLIQEAREAYRSGNLSLAGQKVREAFNTIMEALRRVGEAPGVPIARRVAAGIERNRRLLGRLLIAVSRLEKLGVDVTDLKESLAAASSLLDEAQSLLEEGRPVAAAQKLAEAHKILVRAVEMVRGAPWSGHVYNASKWLERVRTVANRVEERLAEIERRLLDDNRTSAAARVAEVRVELEGLTAQLEADVRRGDLEAARRTAAEIRRLIHLIVERMRGRR